MSGRPPADAAAGAQGRSKKQSQGDAKAGRRRHGLGRTIAQAEEVEIKSDKINLVRLRYEGAVKDGHDDPHRVLVSKVHKAAQLQLSDDRLSVTGYKGFRSARGSHGAHEGALYCEVRVSRMGKTGHCRLGWCTRKAELQAPVGYDTFGFSFRDVDGSKVSNGLREPYGQPFGEGDVVGMYIHLPKGGRSLEPQQNEYTKYKGKWMRIEDPEPSPETLPGSVIAFSVNGVPQGVAFRDFHEGTYYPAVSLYTLPEQTDGATVTLNFGPAFQYPPPLPEGCAPAVALCELGIPLPGSAASVPPPDMMDVQEAAAGACAGGAALVGAGGGDGPSAAGV
ncbi:Set1/Ash2 histone methyltransferase complex subunit ASH2 [Tetrabaena socialis]|uniref:Set1/Ash2 histone methyltransferase complex subunit ASH2 n=1 Tax=Tetrabaena socialis TaxID=47790 RepID=A0A2J7ZWY7_9CHLO|nr:Set1/Ash2 histone methyltransferase complex subunit ASH2 [Tetrabaena socialis]|eukprot:PNH04790.1 Set1/Ash2 histone methyltransferase complex subunit ASH2 [Tetrabaena socialis]